MSYNNNTVLIKYLLEYEHPQRVERKTKSTRMCNRPLLIRNKKKGCLTPYKDRRLLSVPCGHCAECLHSKVSAYISRCVFELMYVLSTYGFGLFLTLTYRESCCPSYEGIPCFSKTDVERYLKRVRIALERKFGASVADKVKYFLVSENGGREGRPHYHIIFFVNHPHFSCWDFKTIAMREWKFGNVQAGKDNNGFLNDQRAIFYLLKYVGKDIAFNYNWQTVANHGKLFPVIDISDTLLKRLKPFVKMSNHLGYYALEILTDADYERGFYQYNDKLTLQISPYILRKRFFDYIKTPACNKTGFSVSYRPKADAHLYFLKRYERRVDKLRSYFDSVFSCDITDDALLGLKSLLGSDVKLTKEKLHEFIRMSFPTADAYVKYCLCYRGLVTDCSLDTSLFEYHDIPQLDLYMFQTLHGDCEMSPSVVFAGIEVGCFYKHINEYLTVHAEANEVVCSIMSYLKLSAYEEKQKEFLKECELLTEKLTYYWRKRYNEY